MKQQTAIITGITGQDGAYLAQLLLRDNFKVVGLTRGYNNDNLNGLSYLGIQEKVQLVTCDLLDISQIIKIIQQIKPTHIYNLAAQSSVSLSFQQPIGTFQFNTLSVFNLLEAIKMVDKTIRFYQASSSEMYGKVNDLPITENSVLHPLSPYAISKAAAHFTCIHYRESYKLHVSCGVLFNHESYLRQNTFFVKKVIQESIKISKGLLDVLKVGNIDIKRDFGYAPKYTEAMYLILQQEHPSDYLICSGQTISLREIIHYIFDRLSISHDLYQIDDQLYRPAEIENIYGNNAKAKQELGWVYDLDIYQTLDLLLKEELENNF
ncbi:GDPmannose 4,6-dehydratase [Pedobacter cryoconitis]|uniref:GDP-mannose 4,6-dehydratase n=1 Tax=Pedobacter cryoconitis TaxID=188932 RepID=UPI00161DE547|nr:GDP-mannose 4,6-dehydratase [Pedobacter cryoconitis]MBB6273477.1 GDPmannose 4,6-dehydratase [Pedobacter cryoconitis]